MNRIVTSITFIGIGFRVLSKQKSIKLYKKIAITEKMFQHSVIKKRKRFDVEFEVGITNPFHRNAYNLMIVWVTIRSNLKCRH
jgi:hypothetical protein